MSDVQVHPKPVIHDTNMSVKQSTSVSDPEGPTLLRPQSVGPCWRRHLKSFADLLDHCLFDFWADSRDACCAVALEAELLFSTSGQGMDQVKNNDRGWPPERIKLLPIPCNCLLFPPHYISHCIDFQWHVMAPCAQRLPFGCSGGDVALLTRGALTGSSWQAFEVAAKVGLSQKSKWLQETKGG